MREVVALVGLVMVSVGLGAYDWRVAVAVVGGLLLGLSVLGELKNDTTTPARQSRQSGSHRHSGAN